MNETRKILLADDTKLFLELEKTFLKHTQLDILTAHDGRQALELARQHRPSVAVLDLNMPEMDGAECCTFIKQDPDLAGMAVVIVTTKGHTQDQERCRKAGCDELMFKPINRTEFVKAVDKYLQIPINDKRFKAKIRIHYGEEARATLTEFSIDISSGGLYISTDSPLAVGELLTLRFSLENQAPEIVCKARVAWVNSPPDLKKSKLPPGMGVQFIDICLEDLHAIRNYMLSNQFEPSW